MAKRLRTMLAVAGITVAGLVGPAPAASANTPLTTLSFVAHEDDDLLFMNPDILSDVQAGYDTWVVYLTAGEIAYGSGSPQERLDYANMRTEGVKAAYARAAKTANDWTFNESVFNGHPVATDTLTGTRVHLLFLYIHAADGASGDNCGDLYRMLHDPAFAGRPIDGRPAYTRQDLLATLRAVTDGVNPDYLRSQSTIGHRDGDHIDHTSAALFAAAADSTIPPGADPLTATGTTVRQRDEYQGYSLANQPDRFGGYWRDEKLAVWNAYKPHDPAVGPTTWDELAGKETDPAAAGRRFTANGTWAPPGDFTNQCGNDGPYH